MLTSIARRATRKRNAQNLYGSIVTLSRAPALYTDFNVPDTLECRFEILVLHMFVYLERLSGTDSQEERALAQEIVDRFFADMDATSRELGVGDMAVPKKMRSVAAVFAERMAAYRETVKDQARKALSDELRQNIFTEAEQAADRADKLARYIVCLRRDCSKLSVEELMSDGIAKLGTSGAVS